MNSKKIGNSTIEVSPICFGGNVFGWTIDEKTSFQLLDAFIDGGANFIDTADVYSRWAPGNKGGESEIIIGNWLRKSGKRNNVVIATKVGGDMGKGDGKTLRKDYILQSAEASLKRLQTDVIDIYQTHFDDETLPVEEALEAYDLLVKQGKVRCIGTSNMSAERLEKALEVSRSHNLPAYQTLQPEYNLYARKHFEETYRQLCFQHNIGVITYYSLASGFLTGKYRSINDLSKSERGKGNQKYLNERGFKILNALDEISQTLQSSPATVSLAWLMAQPTVLAPIASATSLNQMKSLLDAVNVNLGEEALEKLNAASSY